jgi:hypothetical protein
MKTFMIERYGDKAGVRAAEMPDPRVGTDDARVRIHAASVNPLDLKIRDGNFRAVPPSPSIRPRRPWSTSRRAARRPARSSSGRAHRGREHRRRTRPRSLPNWSPRISTGGTV